MVSAGLRDGNMLPGSTALWFNRGIDPKLQGFMSGLFSTVRIGRLFQWESMMVTLSPGIKHQCTMEKSQQIIMNL